MIINALTTTIPTFTAKVSFQIFRNVLITPQNYVPQILMGSLVVVVLLGLGLTKIMKCFFKHHPAPHKAYC